MRVLLLVVAAVVVIAVVWQARIARHRRGNLSAGHSGGSSSSGTPAEGGTQDLRLVVLRREFLTGVAPAPGGEPRAVVMDWGLGNGAASVVAYDDGTTSLYLSSGGGVIGAGAHEAVRRAARTFQAEAAAARGEFSVIAADDPLTLPGDGTATFYLVTDSATLRAGPVETRLLAAGTHVLARVGERAQDVITAIREASPQ
jgi:hypothetical protein